MLEYQKALELYFNLTLHRPFLKYFIMRLASGMSCQNISFTKLYIFVFRCLSFWLYFSLSLQSNTFLSLNQSPKKVVFFRLNLKR